MNAIKWTMTHIKGNISEKIIQNSMAYKLREMGVDCQQEVVMPVLAANVFVGYNRFDLFIPYTKNNKTMILIIELKYLKQSLKKRFAGSRVHEQCIGYKSCASRIFGKDVGVDVCVLNTWRVSGKIGQYKNELIMIPTTQSDTIVEKNMSRISKNLFSIGKKIRR